MEMKSSPKIKFRSPYLKGCKALPETRTPETIQDSARLINRYMYIFSKTNKRGEIGLQVFSPLWQGAAMV